MRPATLNYVHGYDRKESIRLQEQASSLAELLHFDTFFPGGSQVLEAGCGVGAQTITLAGSSPHAHITAVDISEGSLGEAREKIEAAGFSNVSFRQGDIFELPFKAESFDHIFVCFVLEHLTRPADALTSLRGLLKAGGTITVIEGDHGSTYMYPDSEAAHVAIQCQVELQRRGGGNANIGRELYPLLKATGFSSINVSPRVVYAHAGNPRLVEGFTKNTFTAMIEGIREAAIEAELVEPTIFDEGVRGLYRAAEEDGVFCYTYFKAVGTKE